MPRLSDMPPPGPLTGLELTPLLQGGGLDGNVGVPILAYGALPRGAVLLLRTPMVADLSATSDADPGAGNVRWNHATPASATEIYISKTDADAGDIASQLLTVTLGGYLYLQSAGAGDAEDRDILQKWQVATVDDETGYVRVGVVLVASSGSMIADDPVELTVQQPAPSPGIDRNVVTAAASASGVLTIDAALGDYFVTTLTENITSWSLNNVPQACTLSVRIMQDASTARTVAFPASFLRRGGGDFTMPATLGARHRLIMTTDDYGTTWDVELAEDYK